MKKALSILLALTLAMSCVIIAAAKEPVKEPQDPFAYQTFEDKLTVVESSDVAGSLIFALPNVTGIEAVWDGTILVSEYFYGLYDYDYYYYYGWVMPPGALRPMLRPVFTPENVEITVYFDEGDPETLSYWWDEGNGWYWDVFYKETGAGELTFYYVDSNLYAAYLDTLDDPYEDYKWDDLAATLPQATIAVPENLLQLYVDGLEKSFLELDESQSVTLDEGGRKLFVFVPEEDGVYYFYSENNGESDPLAVLATDDFFIIRRNDDYFGLNFGIAAELKAGETYYLFASTFALQGGEYDLAVTRMNPISPFMQFVYRYLMFGWLWMPALTYNGAYYIPGVSVSLPDILARIFNTLLF
ncbi:MAG: hypothetical protein FWF08_03350 [Oscillospiraceae bacterium]|nr:hypothetical protein [Oscillospiraceae bacterium]